MQPRYLMGVDIGTYASKGVITRPDGEVVDVQVRPHDLTIPRSGWAEHDAEAVWWGDFVAITRALLAESGVEPARIAAVGCSAIGPDLLPVDAAARPLRKGGILYGIDTRATDEIGELEARYGADAIFEATGNPLTSQAVGPKLLWLQRHEPEVFQQADRFVTATSFVVARLTGKFVIDHLTASTWVPLYDLANLRWSDRFCEGIVEPARLPDPAWTTEIAGGVTAEASGETGLREGTPVIVGTCDAPAEAVSVGVTAPGQMMLMYGSTVFMIRVTDRLVTDRRVWAVPYLFPGTWCLEAGMATSGALTRWFRDQCAPDLVAVEGEGGPIAYAELAQAAADVPPGSEGLLVLPYFSGERTPINDPQARGVIFGLTLAHTRAHMFRAILEGIGYGVRHHVDVMTEMGVRPEEIVAVGGGTQNEVWMQAVSDIAGISQRVPAITLGASYGDAFLAGLGISMFDSYDDVGHWLNEARTIAPIPSHADVYRRLMKLYLELYQRTKDMMAVLGRIT